MALLAVNGLEKHFGADLIFSEVNFQVERGEKIALVGQNGAGKSTLLKIVAGMVTADGGTMSLNRGTRVAYLAQEVRFSGERTLWQEMEAAFGHLVDLQAEMHELEQRIADTEAHDWEASMERYGDLAIRFEHAGGYEMEQRIKRALQGLGFTEVQYHQRVGRFSGGQKTRAALAATLLSDPDLLLLDEPTNHLDMQALEWLEGFLGQWDGTLMVISHDRYFLDRVTKRTLELIFGTLEDYPGGYNRYLELKAERIERRVKEYEAQQDYIAKTEDFIRRYKAGQRSREAKGREKRLDRMKKESLIQRPQEASKLKLFLDTQLRSGDIALSLDGLVVGYGRDKRQPAPNSDGTLPPSADHPMVLLRTDGLDIQRGERVALLGPNGSGKTTLLRTIVSELKSLQGTPRLGHNVMIGYYAQGHDVLDMNATVLDELLRVSPRLGEERARTLLGRFLFSGDDVFKQVGMLSGGERSRVALAQLTLLPGNLLILDEPTNHLDIDAREALEGVLKEYPGSILFVSHDRYFIDALADKVWVAEQGHVSEHLGNYSIYMAKLAAQQGGKAGAPVPASQTKASKNGKEAAPPASSGADRQRKRRLAALEAEVALLEQELEQLKTDLETASVAQDVQKLTDLGKQYAELEVMLTQRYRDWEQLAA